MIALLTAFLAVVTGAFGWWVTNFFVGPLRRIEDLRQRAHEELIFYANIGKDSPETDRATARLALRRVAVGLMAAAESASPLISWWLKRRGWDLHQGGTQLLAVANTLGHEVEPNQQIIVRDDLDRALGLSPKYSDQMVRTARTALRIPDR